MTHETARITVVGLTSPVGPGINPERYHYQVSFVGGHYGNGWCFGKTPDMAAENAVNDVVSRELAYNSRVIYPSEATDIHLVQG